MTVTIPSLSEKKNISISEFTLNDFRSISFMIDNNDDVGLYKLLVSKIETKCNAFDKFYILFKARLLFVNELITLNNGTSNISINLGVWEEVIRNNVVDIRHDITFENINVSLNYPEHLIYDNYEDLIIDCIYNISINDKELIFTDLSREDKDKIIEKLPPSLIILIKDYIDSVFGDMLVIMQSKLGLPEISVNIFDGSAYELIKILFNYYKYDDILELIFMLSRRIKDIGYINSRTPKDLDFLVKLHAEEVEKTATDDKLSI